MKVVDLDVGFGFGSQNGGPGNGLSPVKSLRRAKGDKENSDVVW